VEGRGIIGQVNSIHRERNNKNLHTPPHTEKHRRNDVRHSSKKRSDTKNENKNSGKVRGGRRRRNQLPRQEYAESSRVLNRIEKSGTQTSLKELDVNGWKEFRKGEKEPATFGVLL